MAPRHAFGPVPSRRLGRSLGINPIPFKTCTYNCAYCQLGRTTHLTLERRDYLPPDEIEAEMVAALAQHGADCDCVTFVGEGEPTLCASLGRLIRRARTATGLPVAVITNGSLLYREDVREELLQADIVMPSLDAAREESWRRVNRPHGRLGLDEVVDGLATFRRRFAGKLWLEVMLVAGVNDGEQELLALRRVLEQVGPEQVHVNVPVRPPAEAWVEPPDDEGLVRAHAVLGETLFIGHGESGDFDTSAFADPAAAVTAIVRRHPMRREQVAQTLRALGPEAVEEALRQLEGSGAVRAVHYRGQTFYTAAEARHGG